MPVKRVSPQEAADLQKQGYVYVDVRSAPEFEAGRTADSVNIPFMHKSALGMSPNPEFLAALKASFAPGSKFVLACQAGNRSLKAAELLLQQGYADVVEQQGGFAGWAAAKLPVETGPATGRDWESMKSKKG